jgi:hypothetical protein
LSHEACAVPTTHFLASLIPSLVHASLVHASLVHASLVLAFLVHPLLPVITT